MIDKAKMVIDKGYVINRGIVYNGNTVVEKLDDLSFSDIEKLPVVK